MRYFIYDCNDQIVGNPKGYRTFRGADRERNRRGSAAHAAIWNAFDAQIKKNSNVRVICAIRIAKTA